LGNGITIRRARARDIPAIMAIEREVFPYPWSQRAFVQELANDVAVVKVLSERGKVKGYYDLWRFRCEAHLLNLAVDRTRRRRGWGERLLNDALAEARKEDCETVMLEVRASNEVAIRLYAKHGFRPAGRRRRYYGDGEDAIVMAKEF
jgi:ribosomal-protein-alanine N-acetyltransferase